MSRTEQGEQGEPSVKRPHCVLSGETQRLALSLHQSEEMEIQIEINISYLEWASTHNQSRLQSHITLLRHNRPL